MLTEISIKKATWQEWQRGLTMRILPEPREYPSGLLKKRKPEADRLWWVEKVQSGEVDIYSMHHVAFDLVGFVHCYKNLTCSSSFNFEVLGGWKDSILLYPEILDYLNYGKGFSFLALKEVFTIYEGSTYLACIHKDDNRSIKLFQKLNFTFMKETENNYQLFKK